MVTISVEDFTVYFGEMQLMPNEHIIYTWDQLHTDTTRICDWAKEVGFIPDVIVGIVRGGAVPAVIASHIFNIPVELVNWSLRDHGKKDTKKLDQLALSSKRCLFIEDIVDSGETMKQIKERMFDTNRRVLYTCLHYNPNQTNATVHFHANIVDRAHDDRWVIYPYEA